MNSEKRLWYYIRNYKFNSILIRNFFLIFVAAVIPITAMVLIVYNIMNDAIEEEIEALSINALYNTRDVLNTVVGDIDLMATQISLEPDAQMFFMSTDPQGILNNKYRDVYHIITTFRLVHPYIDSIYIYSKKNQYIISSREGGSLERFSDTTWLEQYAVREGNEPWIQARKKNGIYPYYISVIRPAYLYEQERYGAVIINIDVEELGKMIGNRSKDLPESIFVIDENGTILYSEKSHLVAQNISDVDLLAYVSDVQEDYSEIMDLKGEKYVVSIIKCRVREWTYISLIPLERFFSKIEKVQHFISYFLILGILIAIFFAVFLSFRSFKPVKNIMDVIEDPDSYRSINKEENTDELKFIANNIIRIVSSNKQLKDELETRLVLLNKAHFSALQAQINPHFIHNTLEAINWTAARALGKKNDISYIVANLSKLLRLSFDVGSELFTIKEELEHAMCYVNIMKMRYFDKFDVIWDIPQEIWEYKIIKLCLQPIIENAIYHGIKPQKQKGIIKIEGEMHSTEINIRVRDNGVGMSDEDIAALNKCLNEEYVLKGENIGLLNIAQRIKLTFGEDYGLSIYKEEPQGIIVSIAIPKVI